ncbi:hypothetical protein [Flavobacterium macrobrachii]|uniref:Uncharacterized protein n=1 Tax=Flavobacterium macrobrachii TaxID=591204 RepID=A0ABS2CZ18_9FLAO|nr:hypothetical protein [Flavobacterium macrobrachii]MBM6500193.1 hypothetical protein [Flavobacterium macrobrachii]
MTEVEVDVFEKVQTQLEGMYEEISLLSKKSQNDGLSLFKLKFINKILIDSNKVLGTRYKPFEDFEIFDENNIPTNSDVAMILTQYINCFEKLRTDNIYSESKYNGNKYENHWYWKINNKQSEKLKTSEPKKLK